MTGQSLNQHLPLKKKKHNTIYGFSHFSTQYWLSVSLYNKEFKKKKTLQFISVK